MTKQEILEYNKRFDGKKLNHIYRNNDDGGYVLTYSLFHKSFSGMIFEFERNTRKELKCFEDAN